MKVLLTASFLLSVAAIGLGFAATMHAKARTTSVGSAEFGAVGAESDVLSSSTIRAEVRTLATSALNHPAPAAPEPPPSDPGPRGSALTWRSPSNNGRSPSILRVATVADRPRLACAVKRFVARGHRASPISRR